MKQILSLLTIVVLSTTSTPSLANGFSTNVGESTNHSAQAIAHGSAAGLKLGASVVSIPFIAVGEIGKVSGNVGTSLNKFSVSEFPIGDETVSKLPSPREALNSSNSEE